MPVCKLVFLTGEVEYCQSYECLGSWLSLEHSMMKYSMLFECGTMSTSCPPDIIHVIDVPGPFPFFAALPLRTV